MLKQSGFIFLFLGMVLIAGGTATAKSGFDPHETSDTTILVQLDSPESEVRQAVQEVSEDQIIHGTYSYEKEKTLYGAHSADASAIFGVWQNPGRAFYKVADNVLAPRFFKDSGDVGTVTVRYVVEAISPSSTSLRIDAVYFDARHARHKSNGNVESKEYEAVQEHLRSIQAQQKQDAAAEQRIAHQREAAHPAQASNPVSASNTPSRLPADSSAQSLEQKVESLRRQLELRVKTSGAVLKSAPYKSATTIQSLPAAAVVVVVVLTRYWYGVETEDGHKGWVHRSELEQLP
jgi:hypothetical protein